ncbi:MAG: hypothetical protein N4A72_11540 [Bacteroidales bacterium]|jgi:hypothetical protein|nr:hypothetical protein [Bacteroidales bacterium]
MNKLVGSFFVIIVFLFSSCTEQREEAPLIGYESEYNCTGFTLFTTPNLYVVNDTSVNLVAEFENYTQVLYYNDKYVIINEVLKPYKSNNIVYIDLLTKEKLSYKIANLDCLQNGGILASYCVNESNDNIHIIIGYKDKRVILYDGQKQIVKELKESALRCNTKYCSQQPKRLGTALINKRCKNNYVNFFCKKLHRNHIITTKNNKTYSLPIKAIRRIDEN